MRLFLLLNAELVCVRVFVCVCERERDRACVCVRERETERVCVRERELEIM